MGSLLGFTIYYMLSRIWKTWFYTRRFFLYKTYFENCFWLEVIILHRISLHVPSFRGQIRILKGVLVDSYWLWLPRICYLFLETLPRFPSGTPCTLLLSVPVLHLLPSAQVLRDGAYDVLCASRSPCQVGKFMDTHIPGLYCGHPATKRSLRRVSRKKSQDRWVAL